MQQQQQPMQMQQAQQPPPPQMVQQQFIPQQMQQQAINSAQMTQVSHRSQPTLVSIQRPPQTQIIPQQVQQVPMQMTAVHRPTNTTTAYVQQAQLGQQAMRPATITTAQHRTVRTGIPMGMMQNPTIIPSQNIVYSQQPMTRVVGGM